MTKDQYLTKAGLKKLEDELELIRKKRRDIAVRIQDAKELGDLSENAEYAEAKNAQAFNEGRIQEIEEILKNAVVIAEGASTSFVKPGCVVKVEIDGVEKTFTIVGSNEADPGKGLISNESPMGEAFMNRKVGETVEVMAPKGKIVYKILQII